MLSGAICAVTRLNPSIPMTFTVEAFANEMEGIYTTSVGQDTLDECPMAYKPIDSIVNNIGPTVDIVKIIRPVYNFKASE